MIKGDEGKPMSIMEQISDEPCEAEAYLDYKLNDYRAFFEQTRATPMEERAAHRWGLSGFEQRDLWLGSMIITLEDIKRKMHRHDKRVTEGT